MKLSLKLIGVLMSLGIIGCQSQREVRVYEKVPLYAECRKYTDYQQIVQCERQMQGPENRRVNHVMRQSEKRINRIYHYYRCQERPNQPEPPGCSVNIQSDLVE